VLSKNITGKRYGRLTAIERSGSNGQGAVWLCQCDCGNLVKVVIANLNRGHTRSCGCIVGKKHGGSFTKLYALWISIKNRCSNSNIEHYKYYGGRGIKVCDEWLNDFPAFRDWALANGYSEGLEIDRENNDGNYEPGNCRFIKHIDNSNNRRNKTRITAFGDTKTITEWSNDPRCNVPFGTLYQRLKNGWDAELAISKRRS